MPSVIVRYSRSYHSQESRQPLYRVLVSRRLPDPGAVWLLIRKSLTTRMSRKRYLLFFFCSSCSRMVHMNVNDREPIYLAYMCMFSCLYWASMNERPSASTPLPLQRNGKKATFTLLQESALVRMCLLMGECAANWTVQLRTGYPTLIPQRRRRRQVVPVGNLRLRLEVIIKFV